MGDVTVSSAVGSLSVQTCPLATEGRSGASKEEVARKPATGVPADLSLRHLTSSLR